MDQTQLTYGAVEITFRYDASEFSFRDLDSYAKQRFGIDQDAILRYQRNGIGKLNDSAMQRSLMFLNCVNSCTISWCIASFLGCMK